MKCVNFEKLIKFEILEIIGFVGSESGFPENRLGGTGRRPPEAKTMAGRWPTGLAHVGRELRHARLGFSNPSRAVYGHGLVGLLAH